VPDREDIVWTARGTTPAQIEAALRDMLSRCHAENASCVPARALNLVCVVDAARREEIEERLRQVGRYHASRNILCVVEAQRARIDATATMAAEFDPLPGEFAVLRETVVVEVGGRHVAHLDTVVDPLVVTDLPTVVWAPHGHGEAVRALLGLAQVVLLDSVDEPDLRDALRRAREPLQRAYVVDLAWLRSTPWRERVAATFDPPDLRPDLGAISAVAVRHHPESAVAGLLLVGWLASRLGWGARPLDRGDERLGGRARGPSHDVRISLEPVADLAVRGLAGLTLETASGRWLSLDRGPGGLRAHYRNARGDERRWTVLGASRGEAGILGEGIRQALLRDPTYAPALEAASALAPAA
jgi:glucose-6-phosphate dehydrogenase assembly protein OpcA